jgi:pyruvate dehydrogenase E1 component alpha subunit
MLRSRLFEEAVSKLWSEGLISGEMHLGMGEEAICAGVNAHLQNGDAVAMDHRGTPPLIMRGTDPKLILYELLGSDQGLCRGRGGHMHLFDERNLMASSGIVGAAGPGAVGFALAAQYLRPGTIAVAYFGEGAINQGMLLESFNLSVAWRLPVIFVCKNNDWSITTPSHSVTGGNPIERAQAFGLSVQQADGMDVKSVYRVAGEMIGDVRKSGKPGFMWADCVHLEGHFLGDPLLQFSRSPVKQVKKEALPMMKSAIKRGGVGLKERLNAIKKIVSTIGESTRDHYLNKKDPLLFTREEMHTKKQRLHDMETEVKNEIRGVVESVLSDFNFPSGAL